MSLEDKILNVIKNDVNNIGIEKQSVKNIRIYAKYLFNLLSFSMSNLYSLVIVIY